MYSFHFAVRCLRSIHFFEELLSLFENERSILGKYGVFIARIGTKGLQNNSENAREKHEPGEPHRVVLLGLGHEQSAEMSRRNDIAQ